MTMDMTGVFQQGSLSGIEVLSILCTYEVHTYIHYYEVLLLVLVLQLLRSRGATPAGRRRSFRSVAAGNGGFSESVRSKECRYCRVERGEGIEELNGICI